MKHKMGLYQEYFNAIQAGRKRIEVWLNDEKRREIKVGDMIEFVEVPSRTQILQVQVIDLQVYETFEKMYEEIPFKAFDCEGWTMKEMIEGTYEIFTKEQEKEWGALAITIQY